MLLVSAVFVGTAGASHIPTVDLGTAESFGVLAGQGVTNTGPTVVEGDVGSFPNTSVGGFPPGLVQNGTINPSYTAGAKDDLVTAYVDAAGRTPVTTVGTELGGQVLTHGIYDSAAGTFGITGTLTLDAEGDPNAVWIFKAASTLITGSGSNVNLINGASPCNVFWVVGSSATLGTASTLRGTILSLASITMTTGATLEGRALARNAAVTLDTNTITNDCAGAGPGEPTVTTQVSAAQVTVGGAVTDTATVTGLAASPDRGSLVFSAYGPNDPTCAGQPAYTSNAIPVTAAGNGLYTSSPAFTPSAPGTYLFVVDYNGDSVNDAFATTCGAPNETVTVIAAPVVAPSVAVTKTAGPGTLPEPGGVFTFTVGMTNTSAAPITILTITDNVYGNLATAAGSTCSTLIGDILAPGAAASCTFTGTFNGNAGDTENDTVTATVGGSGGQTATGSDEATVSLTDALPSLTVSKTASPVSLPEPGGNFTFTVVVTNTSVEPLRITSITDSIYGNLATLTGSTCGAGINMSLAASPGPNNSFTCSFTVAAIGSNGAQETDRVTATGRDDEGNTTSGFDEATITITAPPAGPVITPPVVPIVPRIQVPAVVTPVAPAALGVITPPAVAAQTPAPTAAPAPAVAAPSPAAPAKALVRTGTDTLPLLGLACNLIVFGFLLLSPAASRRRYSRSHT